MEARLSADDFIQYTNTSQPITAVFIRIQMSHMRPHTHIRQYSVGNILRIRLIRPNKYYTCVSCRTTPL